MRRLAVLCALVASVAFDAAAQETLQTIPIRRGGIISERVGFANFAVVDLTKNGRPDVLSCSLGAPFAVELHGTEYNTVWYGQPSGCSALAAGDRNGDGGADVIVVTESPTSGVSGRLLVFDPRSLGPATHSIQLPGTQGAADVLMGNVDLDAAPEIIVVTTAATYVYDGATLALEWTASGFGGTEASIGDVDGDSAPEIVVNGTTGSVLDAAAKSLKWAYLGGFGRRMVLGNVDGDAKDEILFITWSPSVTILQGDTFETSTVAGPQGSYAFDCLLVGDGDGDGENEIILGNNQWGPLQAIRPSGGNPVWLINHNQHGSHQLALADTDSDGKPEVIWGAGAGTSGADGMFIGDPVSQRIEWRSQDLGGPFSSASGDLDGDGKPEYVVASMQSESGYSGGIVDIFDGASPLRKRRLLMGPSSFRIGAVHIGQVDGDPQKEIILSGNDYSSALLRAYDGVTWELEWSSSGPVVGPRFLVANIDGDAVDEIIVATSDFNVIVLNGASNVIQASAAVASYVRDLALADVTGDGKPDVVVATAAGVSLIETAPFAVKTQVSIGPMQRIDATSGGGGLVAVTRDSGAMYLLAGTSLTTRWTCTAQSASALRFLDANWLIAGDGNGAIRLYPTAGDACPTYTVTSTGRSSINDLHLRDLTGDGRVELLADTWSSYEINLAGFASALRGDADGNGSVEIADADAVAGFLHGTAPGIAPSADAHPDQRISIEDAFRIIAMANGGGE